MESAQIERESRWFIFTSSKLLVVEDGGSLTVPLLQTPVHMHLDVTRQQRIGVVDGVDCYAAEVAGRDAAPAGWQFHGLRSIYGRLPETLFKMAMLAVHVLEWDRTSLFCGRCGAPLTMRGDVRAKECAACNALVFPRISPAVIVAIERGDRLLLARASRFAEEIYSVLAGFVEPGETLEETVYREVKEEVGITVKNIRYFGSQPWPFPDSLMVGFTAEYDAGEIAIDGEEIVAAQWFTVDQLPSIPGRISIARRLIDAFIEKHRNGR
jgi:NAD+ diphosphatase